MDRKWLCAAMALSAGCGNPPPAATPSEPPSSAAPPTTVAVPAAPPAGSTSAAPPSSTPRAELVNTNGSGVERPGFTRNPNDLEAPLLRIVTWTVTGKLAAGSIEDTFVAGLSAIYDCYDQWTIEGDETVAIRFTLDASGKAKSYLSDKSMVLQAAESAGYRGCLSAALASLTFGAPDMASRPFGYFQLRFFPHAKDASALPSPRDPKQVTVRAGNTCWEFHKQPPCPPRKRCFPDEDVRVRCP